MTEHRLTLRAVDGTFSVCRLPADAPVPSWALAGDFVSITRNTDELSVVCCERAVPDGVVCERGWRCLRVAGVILLTMVGVLAALSAPLAKAGIALFALSTFDTDYLLVRAADFDAAVDALRRYGHTVSECRQEE